MDLKEMKKEGGDKLKFRFYWETLKTSSWMIFNNGSNYIKIRVYDIFSKIQFCIMMKKITRLFWLETGHEKEIIY